MEDGCNPIGHYEGTAAHYGVKPLDASIYLLSILGVATVALLASALPASRAASVDPMRALRTE